MRRPPRSTRSDTPSPYTTLFRSLLGDGEQAQQVLHRQVGLARDEIERAVMRPAQPLRGQPLVDRAGERGIAEIEHLYAPPDLILAQEQRRSGRDLGCGGGGRGMGRGHAGRFQAERKGRRAYWRFRKIDWKSVGEGKSVSGSVSHGGCRCIKKKKT